MCDTHNKWNVVITALQSAHQCFYDKNRLFSALLILLLLVRIAYLFGARAVSLLSSFSICECNKLLRRFCCFVASFPSLIPFLHKLIGPQTKRMNYKKEWMEKMITLALLKVCISALEDLKKCARTHAHIAITFLIPARSFNCSEFYLPRSENSLLFTLEDNITLAQMEEREKAKERENQRFRQEDGATKSKFSQKIK